MRNANMGRFLVCIGVGAALGVATGQLAIWLAIGAGLGSVFMHRPVRCAR